MSGSFAGPSPALRKGDGRDVRPIPLDPAKVSSRPRIFPRLLSKKRLEESSLFHLDYQFQLAGLPTVPKGSYHQGK
jgi:hypothetical protein